MGYCGVGESERDRGPELTWSACFLRFFARASSRWFPRAMLANACGSRLLEEVMERLREGMMTKQRRFERQ